MEAKKKKKKTQKQEENYFADENILKKHKSMQAISEKGKKKNRDSNEWCFIPHFY